MIFRFSWNVLSVGTKELVNTTGSSARVGLPFKIPKGRTYSPPAEAGGGSPCGARALSEGGIAISAEIASQCRPACGHWRASAARLTHISQADSDQHGKYADGMISMPVNRVCKPATGSFFGVWIRLLAFYRSRSSLSLRFL